MARDFTLAKYTEICRALVEAGYCGLTIGDYLAQPARAAGVVLLRHDVESDPRQAVRAGAIEQACGLPATYFFRLKRSVLRAECIAELRAQGHEIGYHYETLSKARGDLDRAVELFGRELARLRELAPVRVASMHGSPLLPWDNRQIWSRVRPEDFGLLGEAYQAVDGRQVHYFSDTGRTWHPTRFNIRDRSVAAQGPVVESSDQLIELIRAKRCPGLCLLTHAERWSATPSAWAVRAVRDGVENLGKLTLARAYSVWRALQPRPRP